MKKLNITSKCKIAIAHYMKAKEHISIANEIIKKYNDGNNI